jgi:hypothetical protein
MSTVYEECKSSPGVYPPPSTCHPELLTFVLKARGDEAHKGGELIFSTSPDGGPDPQDVCVVTWLEGRTNGPDCEWAKEWIPQFPTPDASDE